jgi:hypothetical protein
VQSEKREVEGRAARNGALVSLHVLLAELVVKNFSRCEVAVVKGRGRADMLIEKFSAGGFQKQSVG